MLLINIYSTLFPKKKSSNICMWGSESKQYNYSRPIYVGHDAQLTSYCMSVCSKWHDQP